MSGTQAKTAFVFAGGDSLGAVQVGMLHTLLQAGLQPDFVVGSSVGAINAAYFAEAPDIDGVTRLAEIWTRLRRADIFPLALSTALSVFRHPENIIDPSGLRYGDLDILNQDRFEGDAQAFDASEVRLCDFQFRYDDGPSFVYVYDFGDDWRHTIEFEKLLALNPASKASTCIEGARCCPPEDVGGPHGYFEFVRVLLSPEPDELEEQRHLKRWSGGKFDPERFDVAKTDKAVRGVLRKRRRE